MLSIIIVFPKREDAENIRSLLVRNSFDVHAVCTTGAQAVSIANGLDGGIVISGYRMPDMLYREINNYLPKGFEMLLIASAARFEEVCGDSIMAVRMPLKARELIGTLHIMTQKILQKERKKHTKPIRSEQEKTIIEKAKLILMQRNNMSEEEAHRYLQKNSMDSGVNLIEMAEMLISMF